MEAPAQTPPVTQTCYHCGEDCSKDPLFAHDHAFCCQGCKTVYEILEEKGMCQYYTLEQAPGANRKKEVRADTFAFLEDEKIQSALIRFSDHAQSHVVFYLPQIHCSSCLWLLENLHRIAPAVISSKVQFEKKEVELVFDHRAISLRQLAELLTSVGYEPHISTSDLDHQPQPENKARLYRLGVAGFCFANIMLMSFPEYLGIDSKEEMLQTVFRYANLVLSLPVFFYSAAEFYNSAWKSLKHQFLNIDAPIVLAVWVTFIRSLYEVVSGTGSGYFDSMSGIVFFMLAGRILQDKTYRQLSFERDYTAYFPIAVTRLVNGNPESVMLSDIRLNDTLLIHQEELIPADGILTRGHGLIDYSFVTGESLPVPREMGEIIYAGGKQSAGTMELLVIREVAQSYLTRLWNRTGDKKQPDEERSFVHLLSRHFTWIVFSIAFLSAAYWYFHNPAMVWRTVTAILIVACPCALLLSNTFTNANILRRLGRNHCYLRNAQVIEDMAAADCIVFDKTGTLTTGRYQEIQYEGAALTACQKQAIGSLANQSLHPLSRAIADWAGVRASGQQWVKGYREYPGKGIEGIVEEELIALGSASFVLGKNSGEGESNSIVWVSV
ncbi:MAG TPA: heavy metal translocating P-type ATPase metal-binding domain-containing protein, partial [Sediminibacterium sp.]|nr:heavy metal translocating P-type ATPase metal-binding domain-containing protein [Sediminibacterium sp.]